MDGVRPTPELAATSVDGSAIFIIFSETLAATTAPANAFTLSVDTGTAPAVSTATASGNSVTLGLASAVTSSQAVTVTYVDPTSGDDAVVVQDAAGNDAANFTTGAGDVPAVANAVGTGCSLVAGCYVVPADWGLIPTGLGAGAEFRLIFISSGTRNVASTDIADYNTFVQAAAAAGHADIQDYSSDFRVVGSTADVDARDNTDTTYTADDKGVAIHWLGGNKVADDYDDFYDETWDDEVNSKDESGNNRSISGLSNWPFTGSDHDGTERNRGSSTALGAGVVTRAQPNSSGFDTSPLSSNNAFNNTVARPLYGLSPVFRVEGQVVTNTAPAFTTGADFSTNENQAATFQVTAMDADAGDEVSYAITGGADLAVFGINVTSGLLVLPTGFDHENPSDADSNNVYLVTVTATGGTGARALTTDQAINVTVNDVDEPPSAPATPTVSAVDGTTDSLEVSWTAPDNSGKPDIDSYDLQYRKGTTGNFADGPQDVTGLTDTITGLDADSLYQVQVRATNDEGDSGWSSPGSGTTNALAGCGTLPTDRLWSACLTVGEISSGGRYGYQAADSTGSLAPATFDIGTTTYTVTNLFDNDDLGGSTHVRINLAPAISEDDAGSLTLHLGDDTSLSFGDASYLTLSGGSGHQWSRTAALGWSEGDAIVVGITQEEQVNTDPSFLLESSTREVAENSAAGVAVGGPVTATDTDTGDTLTYTLEGTDASSFAIVSTSGQIQTKAGVTYDHESQPEYSVTVKADDGNGGTDTIAVTIDIADVDEPPSAPAEPTVSAVSGTTDSLSVSWTAPDNAGKPDIDSYDLQYRKGTTGNFADGPQDVTGLTTTIAGLDADSLYQVQVRATNDEGDSGWSSAGSGSTNALAEELAETTVPADWGLIPSGLGAGDRFRLLFIGTGNSNASSSDIADYNTFVQALVATNGHADIKALSATFRMLGSTEAVDARDNTGTTGTGVPIYWLGGAKVADHNADFYDGDWDEEAAGRSETGASRAIPSGLRIWTGSAHDGTEAMSSGGTSRALGNSNNAWVMQGSPNSSTSGHGPIESDTIGRTTNNGVYGLSGVFTVSNEPIANASPTFTSAASFSVEENQTDAGTVMATDEDAGDTVSYAVTGGADQAKFDIDASSGVLTFKDAPDHENPADADGNNVYLVTVTATGGTGDRAMMADQAITVTVTDVDETPAVVTVVVTSSPGTGTDTYGRGQTIEVTVTFDQAVRVTGTPRIQLRVGGSDPATQLKWANYDGGSGREALRFTYRVQAADRDTNGIYIEADELFLNSGTIQGVDDDVAANLDYPTQGTQSGHKVDGSLVGTKPSAPAPPWVQALDGSTSALDVRWIEPADSVVDSYDLRYRKDGGGDWEDGPQDVTNTRAEITGLESGTPYEVQVRATNSRGDSGWSPSTTGYPATVYDIDGIYIYWTDRQGSEELHDDVLILDGEYTFILGDGEAPLTIQGLDQGNTLGNACDTGESFRAYWVQPLESRDADEWEADVQTIDGTGTAQYRLQTAPELTGAVSLDGFTVIGIRIRGRFGEDWSNWSRAVNLICVPTEDDSGSATGNSSTGSGNATGTPLTGFELVDATAHLDAGAVEDGATLTGIDPAKVYGFRANVASGAELKSVRLELSGPGPDDRVARTDNDEPYALHGDSDGHEHGAALPAGSYTLTATAHSEKDGGGSELGTLSVEFTVMGEPLTARFEGMPEGTHGGAGETFSLRLVFSEAVSTTPEALRDHALEVTNATVAVSRVDDRSDLWEVRLTPETDAMVTVSLLPAADCDAAGAVCTEDGRMLSVGVARVILGPPPNSAATGAPTISGTAQVGQTLTADTSGIADEDGLDNVTFSYQWMADDANIQGATGSSYTLADRDKGKAIKVRVSFTDDANNEESLPSAATDAVEAAETVPGRPQDLEGNASAQGIALTWKAPAGSAVTHYVVYRAVLDNGQLHGKPMTRYATIDATGAAMAYIDADAEAGVEYRYRVAAANSAGEGKKSNWINIFAGDS